MASQLDQLALCLAANAERNESPQDRSRRDTSVAEVQASRAYQRRVDTLLFLDAIAHKLLLEQRRDELARAEAYMRPPPRLAPLPLPAHILRGYGVEDAPALACQHFSEEP